MRIAISIILVLISSAVGFGQGLSMELDRDTIFIGQPATVTYSFSSVESENNSQPAWFIPTDSIAPGLEILHRVEEKTDSNGVSYWNQKVTFTASATGYFPVPPVSVNYISQSYQSEAFLITAYTTLKNPEQEKLRALKESSEVTYGWTDWILDNWYIILGVIAFLILLAVAIKVLSPKTVEKVIDPEPNLPPPPTAYEIAQQKISELETNKAWRTGELKEFHTSISYLLREYLEGELNISALENTSGEINSALQKFSFPAEVQKQIRVSLTLTDLVKFAKQLPTDAENELVLKDVKEVIDFIHGTESKTEAE